MGLSLFTLTFDSSPIKGEGEDGEFGLLSSLPLPLWIADQVRNDGASGYWFCCLRVS